MNLKKIFLTLIFTLFILFPKPAHAIIASREQITSFLSNITINQDGTIHVVEHITYDFGPNTKHGIIRNIPLRKTNQNGKQFLLTFNDIKVYDEQSRPYNFTTSYETSTVNIKIGDADRLIRGTHQYNISYNVSGALTYFPDHDELYWNSTGNGWTVPILSAETDITLPKSVNNNEIKTTCYTGLINSKTQNCSSFITPSAIVFKMNHGLASQEGLTIVLGFPKNIVAVLEPQATTNTNSPSSSSEPNKAALVIVSILATLWYILLPIYIVILWITKGRDAKSTIGITTASFDPPKTPDGRYLTPAESGTIIDEHIDMKDISATIIDLARRGYIKIIEKEKNHYALKKMNSVEPDKILQPFEQQLFDGIFAEEEEVDLDDAELADIVNDTKEKLYDSVVKQKFFDKNPEKTRNFYKALSIFSIISFNLPLLLTSVLLGRIMPAKTATGKGLANEAQSLKNFLSSQQRQLEFQAQNQLMFEKLLPFAVAFGVEKIWAQRFKDVLITPPDWYETTNSRQFNSIFFVNSLHSSFSSFSSAATPVYSSTSSSSGFSSGFSSSGGSSGGGGGGGGGSSW